MNRKIFVAALFSLYSLSQATEIHCKDLISKNLRPKENIYLNVVEANSSLKTPAIRIQFEAAWMTKSDLSMTIVKRYYGVETKSKMYFDSDLNIVGYQRSTMGVSVGNDSVSDCNNSVVCLQYAVLDLQSLKKAEVDPSFDKTQADLVSCVMDIQRKSAKIIISKLLPLLD